MRFIHWLTIVISDRSVHTFFFRNVHRNVFICDLNLILLLLWVKKKFLFNYCQLNWPISRFELDSDTTTTQVNYFQTLSFFSLVGSLCSKNGKILQKQMGLKISTFFEFFSFTPEATSKLLCLKNIFKNGDLSLAFTRQTLCIL